MGVSAWLLSRAAEMPPVLYLEAAAVGVRFFGISRGVFRYAERLVGHDLALRMQGALRMRVYDRLSRTTLLGRRGVTCWYGLLPTSTRCWTWSCG
ncbi:transport ATP-binding protein CydC [Cutibacterium acnes JCM 18918]|nr:transport ATP-binding protein CydC [Cutibacterium acnes JCM 18918]